VGSLYFLEILAVSVTTEHAFRVLGSVLDRGWVSLELGAVLVPPAEVRAGVAWAF